jgi:transcriptional regulator GlxA family with amidase domain
MARTVALVTVANTVACPAAAAPATGAAAARLSDPMRIAIALFEDSEELDWAGPFEVLATWAGHWPGDGVEVLTVAETVAPIRCAKGLRVLADVTWERLGPIDVLVYPGGIGTRPQIGREHVRQRLRALEQAGTLMTSVCTGALVFADAGLLDGRPATTHWASLDLLASLGRDIDVRASERYVDDGNVITAAGVSAGIDVALHLVWRLHSPARAAEVRREIQYDVQPPV